ncbi:MAG: OmpA family protein [Elusimicrobia bacterium]|nr:OmpA family protein [Elusimicrobiota bacterium]
MRRWLILGAAAGLLLPASQAAAPVETGLESLEPAPELSLAAWENTERDPFSPPVSLRLVRSAAGSPQDQLNGPPPDIRAWQLQFFDYLTRRKVDFIQGRGAPSRARFDWEGVARDGRLLDNGFYNVRFVWSDERGAAHQTEPVLVSLFQPERVRDFLGPYVRLVRVESGLIIRVEEVMAFAPGRWELKPEAGPTLEKVCAFLKSHSGHRVVVQGHADASGSDETNARVSRRRAYAVYRFLAERGLQPGRMSWEGLGASQPVADNATADGRMRNRRVDILLMRAAG